MMTQTALDYESILARTVPTMEPPGAARRPRYDFSVAYPDPESVPLKELVASLNEALGEEGRDLAVYPDPQGYPPLREYVAAKLARTRNIDVSADDVILTAGSSEALHMLIEALVDPGDEVITEQFVYVGTLNIMRRFQADIRGVACDEEGMVPDALEATLQSARFDGKNVKLIYTIPTFQNPLGWTMSLERRRELLRLSQRYNVPVLEDDCYVDLRFEGQAVTSIHSVDDAGAVMYVGSFSKIIAPGMRLGYLTAPRPLLDKLRLLKGGGGVNQFAAFAVHRYATSGLEGHVVDVNKVLRAKRDAMLAALERDFGSVATWNRPDGGLYLWLCMPQEADLVRANQTALAADVGYFAGPVFAPDGVSGRNCARLCFGYNTPQEIHEGIARLAEVFVKAGVVKA